MNTDHVQSQTSAAVELGSHIRRARTTKGLTIASLAEQIGRSREWLNRAELGYSEYGEYPPISIADLKVLINRLQQAFTVPESDLIELAEEAQQDFKKHRSITQTKNAKSYGKLSQTEIIIGEDQIVSAIVDLINEQHSDAIIRNTGIKSLGNYNQLPPAWVKYRTALGEFLSNNPNAVFKRVEYAATPEQLEHAKQADMCLGSNKPTKEVHNAKVKFFLENPLQLHALIGQREAIIALPQTSGQAGSNIAILVRDKIFVEALRVWYDEVLWNAPMDASTVDFCNFDDSFEAIKAMYKFN